MTTNTIEGISDGQQRKRGAVPGNMNAFKTGRRAKRPRLWRGISKYRPDLQEIESICGQLHNQLENECVALGREIDVTTASALDVAAGWQFHLEFARKQMQVPNLPIDEQLRFSRDVAEARERRHKAIVSLDLARERDEDDWSGLKAIPAVPLPDDARPVLAEQQGRQAAREAATERF